MATIKQEGGTPVQDPPQENLESHTGQAVKKEMEVTSSLEDLQTVEQRRVLDTVDQVRKCGLESIVSLPQLVVCGDQSAGKSSVLEALTEIPFPRNDNLCTRFATEIILRRANTNSLKVRLIPDPNRPFDEQEKIKGFEESITNFDQLPELMDNAMTVLDIGDKSKAGFIPRAFARDVLSIEIEGPSRPQLTLVDIPGLIQTDTKGVTKADVDLVGEITDQYIKERRTICLPVVSAANDYANQKILTKVRDFDRDGDRTLGIITKPDRLDSGSGSEKAFIDLAQNQDINFKLGWHVVKNRKFSETEFTLMERNEVEKSYFRTSNFKCLPTDCVGIDALRVRLSKLLFEHVRQELPKLRSDLEKALADEIKDLNSLGDRRSNLTECKTYLTQLSQSCHEVCKAAVAGHYEGDYFTNHESGFSLSSDATIRRLRAVIQQMNMSFSEIVRVNGQKYQIQEFSQFKDEEGSSTPANDYGDGSSSTQKQTMASSPTRWLKLDLNAVLPKRLDSREALEWVRLHLVRNRGKELIGNFNPLLVNYLFCEQCEKWEALAESYLDQVDNVCTRFLNTVLQDKCPKNIVSSLQASLIQDALKTRYNNASQELKRLIEDIKSHPMNYNHYYTNILHKCRQRRNRASIASCVKDATSHTVITDCNFDEYTTASIDIDKAADAYSQSINRNMENFSCEEALDCLFAIYKVSQKTSIANVTTQVIERHMIRGLDKIFDPVAVSRLGDTEVETIASEPPNARLQRQVLEDRIAKLKERPKIFRNVMIGAAM